MPLTPPYRRTYCLCYVTVYLLLVRAKEWGGSVGGKLWRCSFFNREIHVVKYWLTCLHTHFFLPSGLYMWLRETVWLWWCKSCLQREPVYLRLMKMVNSQCCRLKMYCSGHGRVRNDWLLRPNLPKKQAVWLLFFIYFFSLLSNSALEEL